MKLKIAVIDFDIRTERLLKSLLEKEYELHCRYTAPECLHGIALLNPDIIIIDPMYPKRSGTELIKSIREWSNCSVIAVSESTAEHAAVSAFEAGADDYVRKPFFPAELKARIAVCARRIEAEAKENSNIPCGYFYAGLLVDFAAGRVTLESEKIHLTRNEFKILSLLCRHSGKVLTHEFIIKSVWGQNTDGSTGILRVNIANLRRKLGEESKRKYLFTESGVGYFVPEAQQYGSN